MNAIVAAFFIKLFSLCFFNTAVYFECVSEKETFSKSHSAKRNPAEHNFIWGFEKHYTDFDKRQSNQPPVVKIITPANNSAFPWNEPIRYTITVSDKEDGESEYQEIPS